MIVSAIVAIAKNNAIGKNNQLLWHLPADMKYFKEKTLGHCIITGRKNYESIPEKFRPLPGRINIVISRQKNYTAPGAIVVHSIEMAIQQATNLNEQEVFIIGGAEIYKQSLSIVDKLYITYVDAQFDADAFFPELNLDEWKVESRYLHPADDKNKYDCSFCVYTKR